jgi:hypothetical protein
MRRSDLKAFLAVGAMDAYNSKTAVDGSLLRDLPVIHDAK